MIFKTITLGETSFFRDPVTERQRMIGGPSEMGISCEILQLSTHLKNISQIGSFPQVGMKIKKYLKPPPRYSIFSQKILIYLDLQVRVPKDNP